MIKILLIPLILAITSHSNCLAQIPKDVLLFRLSDEQEFNTNPSQDYWTRFLEVVEKNSSFMADQWIVDLREEPFDCYLDSVTGRKVRVNEEGKSLAYFVQEFLSSIGVSSNPDSIWHEANVGFSIKLTQIQVDRLKQIPVVRGVYRDIVFSATTAQVETYPCGD